MEEPASRLKRYWIFRREQSLNWISWQVSQLMFLVNGKFVAKGEVVVIEESFGIQRNRDYQRINIIRRNMNNGKKYFDM